MQKITASILIIGNEILSGRTQDLNVNFIASKLPEIGIHLEEVRIIPDQKQFIINTALELSKKYDYVFSTGGIGPTHDDITAESIAAAFNVPLVRDPISYEIIENYYKKTGRDVPEASAKMAFIPQGSGLIENRLTGAPGFIVENIYVMAGIPDIMQVMFMAILPSLKKNNPISTKQISIFAGESKIAKMFDNLQKQYPDIDMGSYPFNYEGRHATSLVLRSDTKQLLEEAFEELKNLVREYEIIS